MKNKTGKLTKKDLDFNEGTAMWKGKMLKDMTRLELYKAFNAFGKLYEALLDEVRRRP